MSNRPIIRFNGYQSEWQTEKFSSVFTPLKNNTLSRAELNDEEGNAKNVHYGDVLIKFGEYLDAEKEHIPFITSDELAEKLSSFALQNGDIIIADTAEDSTVGKCTEIGNIPEDMAVVSGLHTIPVRPNADFATGYLGYFMNSDAYHDQLLPLIQGTKVSSIAKTYLGETDINFPPDISEQEKIESFLRYLNDLIIGQQQKCEKLIALKSACLDKMFPKGGSDIPELRLGKFDSAWGWHKIGTLTKVSSASRVHKDEWKTDGVPFFRSSDVISAYKGTENTKAFISMELYEELVKSSGKLEENDILITGGGSIGIPYIVPNNKPLYSKDADLIWIKNSPQFDSRYLYVYFACEAFKDYLRSISHVGTIAHYTIEQVKDTPVILPDISEQKIIGNFFFELNNLIDMHKHKVEKLKQLKQIMLNNMFV